MAYSLGERMGGCKRESVTRLAADGLANPADLLLAVSIDDLRDDQGAVTFDKATAAIDAVLAERPHWAKPAPEPERPSSPNVHAGTRAPTPQPLSFRAALRDARFE